MFSMSKTLLCTLFLCHEKWEKTKIVCSEFSKKKLMAVWDAFPRLTKWFPKLLHANSYLQQMYAIVQLCVVVEKLFFLLQFSFKIKHNLNGNFCQMCVINFFTPFFVCFWCCSFYYFWIKECFKNISFFCCKCLPRVTSLRYSVHAASNSGFAEIFKNFRIHIFEFGHTFHWRFFPDCF